MFEKERQRFAAMELFHIQTDQSDGGRESAKANCEQQRAAVQFVKNMHKTKMENVLLSWSIRFSYILLMLIPGVGPEIQTESPTEKVKSFVKTLCLSVCCI